VTLRAYRICRSEHAASMWSGDGARRFGGRWNSRGVAVVYTAESRSLAALEQLVHLLPPRVLRGFVIAEIRFDARDVRRVEPATLPRSWRDPVAPPQLRSLGDAWIASGRPLVLAVPSAVMSEEWNYLLNPAHGDFAALEKTPPTPLVLDARLR
jgi:RES domain-containing protein